MAGLVTNEGAAGGTAHTMGTAGSTSADGADRRPIGALELYGKAVGGNFESLTENENEAVAALTFIVSIVVGGYAVERYILDG